ncbi:MAG TPA: prephenate dehydrogenase/arogenate dehydrogenase family protein [Anaerolineae bacterium]|nr:prephenate dehydrogenase/arogenate dehydrogenase family protein [Anaerolineae bacterium]
MIETPVSCDKPLANCTVAIAGLGLMGGSLGLALRGAVRQVIGIARRAATVQEALAIGAIDVGADDLTAAAEADVIVLATPVSVIMAQIEELGRLARQGRLLDGVVVTDMGSTKGQICAAMDQLPDSVQPVGAHPMCGKESSGLEVAEATLYQDAPFVLCPLPRTAPRTVALMAEMARAVGACPLELDPQRHDRLAAAISHGPYLASLAAFAAAHDVAAGDALAWRLAASGFRSTTRLAGSDPTMMADILLSNRDAVLVQLHHLQAHLAQVAALLTASDAAGLHELAASARAARSQFLETYG